MIYFDRFPSPPGPFLVAVNDEGAVVATTFGEHLPRRFAALTARHDPTACRTAREQLVSYFEGTFRPFTLPLAPQGSEFQHRVWTALRQIPWGETRTYGQIASAVGNPKASRAVGRANATNPLCVIVPCHRVIGANGSLTGFAYGERIKRWLLRHEGSAAGS